MIDLEDLGQYQENCLRIVDKAGENRAFGANFYQRQLNEIARERTRPLRLLILKCRQIGASTWGASFVYQRTATQFHKSGMIIADSDENSTGLFEKCKSFYDWSPEVTRPKKKYSNEKALVFDDPSGECGLNSKISVATAGNMGAGRSKTLQYLHASEFAYWPNAAQVSTGLFQSVPLLNNTAIIIESTANGVTGKGGEFYNRCLRSLDGDNDWRFVFFSWLDNPEYEIIPPRGFKRTPEEQELATRYPALTDAKIMFRRYKIENEMGSALIDPRDQYKQEFPFTPEEAFISSGRPVFRAEEIHEAIRKAKQKKGIKGRFDGTGAFIEDERGSVIVFERPKMGKAYGVGADVAEGLEGGDFSTASVMDKDFNQVAVYCGHIDPDRFGAFLVTLAKFYNGALLAPESNNHGYAVLTSIKNCGYYKVYKREVKEELGLELQDKVGWHTNVKTKMQMIDELVAAFRDKSVAINCEATLREMMTIAIGDDGNIEMNSKDRTVALAIGIQALKQVSNAGEHKAFIPGKVAPKDPLKMTVEEKMRYYKKMEKRA